MFFNRSFSKFRPLFKNVKASPKIILNNNLIPIRFTSTIATNKDKEINPNDTSHLFLAISELNRFGINLPSFPNIISTGPQSSGKTSVLEAICGQEILPKGDGMVTMKPIHLTTLKDNYESFKIGDKEVRTTQEAQAEIERLNFNGGVPKIDVIVRSPKVYNMFVVDLPGLFSVTEDHSDLPKLIKQINVNYVNDKNNIPLVVHAGPSDPATNSALKLIQKSGRENDSIGVITKVDMLEKQNSDLIQKVLLGEKYKLGYGYVSVVLRNKDDIDLGKTVEQKIVEEAEYFKKHQNFKPFGVIELRKKISFIQFDKIRGNIPLLISDVDNEISKLKNSQSFLETLVNDPHNNLPIRLKMLIEKLVGSSLERAEFEEILKKTFKIHIGSYMEKILDSQESHLPEYSSKVVDSHIMGYNSANKSNPNLYKEDNFKELFSYGLVSPILVNSETINNAFDDEIKLACAIPMIDMIVDDPQGKKRMKWNKFLNLFFSHLLIDENIQNIVYNITETEIIKYIDSDHVTTNDPLTRKFAEYLIKEIGSQVYEEKIKFSISAMINTEKRPNIDLFQVSRHICKMHPEHFTFNGNLFELFNKNNKKLKVEIYGDTWNEAYLRAVAEKLSENIYRNVAVNLLDKMVEKLLEMTIDMFNKENAIKEKDKVSDKIKVLNELKKIISHYV